MKEVNGKKYYTLVEAQRLLGENAHICLEPDELVNKKLTPDEAGKTAETELWGVCLTTGRFRRQDQRFFDARLVDRGGWNQLALYEEPDIPRVEGDRVVGHVVVQKMGNLIRVRKAVGLNREILELQPSSYSKDDLCGKDNCQITSITEANPQRINGDMLHFLLEEDFPEEEGMTVAEFVAKTTDGRSLNALVKTGLLKP